MKLAMERQNLVPAPLLPALAALLLSIGCASTPAPAPAPSQPAADLVEISQSAGPEGAAKPVPPSSDCPGYDERIDANVAFEGALAEARATGRRVLVILGENGCPWCRVLCEEMQLPDLAAAAETGFVVLKVDVGRGDRNPEVQRRVRATGVGLPHFVVVDANEKILVSETTATFQIGDGRVGHHPELILDFLKAWTGPPAPPPPQ